MVDASALLRRELRGQPFQFTDNDRHRLAVGSIAGILLGLAAGRVLEHVVYQATAHDPIVLVAAVAVMCGIGLGATWLPARRALRSDPPRAAR